MTNLTALSVQTAKETGKDYKLYDGNRTGLYLQVRKNGSQYFAQRLRIHGRVRYIGIGSTRFVKLREAREAALENQKIARAGGDPLALKKRPQTPTFAEGVEAVLAIHAANWKDSGKSEKQWRASLRDYAMKRIGDRRVSDITTSDVMAVLIPIWNTKRETARRVRQRIGAVMKWAVAQGYREDNPAGEAIGAALPKNGTTKKHFQAVPHKHVAAALQKVKRSDAGLSTKLALQLLTLTACRSGEVRGAQWDELDLEARTWTVPAERMKSKRPHTVPLSEAALNVILEAKANCYHENLIFPSPRNKPLSDNTLSKLLRDLNIKGTPHGMRTAFRSWCAETGQNREAAEECLAHVNPNKVEAAYQRSSLLELRRKVMQAWADYLAE